MCIRDRRNSVFDGKAKAGERFSATGRHGQRVNATLAGSCVQTFLRDIPTKNIYRTARLHGRKVPLQTLAQDFPSHIGAIGTIFPAAFLLKIGGIDTVRVNQAAKKKTNSQADLLLQGRSLRLMLSDPLNQLTHILRQPRRIHQLISSGAVSYTHLDVYKRQG